MGEGLESALLATQLKREVIVLSPRDGKRAAPCLTDEHTPFTSQSGCSDLAVSKDYETKPQIISCEGLLFACGLLRLNDTTWSLHFCWVIRKHGLCRSCRSCWAHGFLVMIPLMPLGVHGADTRVIRDAGSPNRQARRDLGVDQAGK